MTDLETRARSATSELLERTHPDTAGRYADLRGVRARRTTAKIAAAGAVIALAVGGWQLGAGRDQRVEPAAPAPGVGNGVLLGHFDVASDNVGWGTALGAPPPSLPSDAGYEPLLQFSPDGRTLYYSDTGQRLAAWDVVSGAEHPLVPCPRRGCLGGAVSPDGRSAVFPAKGNALLVDLETGATTPLDLPDTAAGVGAWSPDGTTLAFTTPDGLWTMDVAHGGEPELVRAATDRSAEPDPSVAWSPDGSRIAYFDAVRSTRGSSLVTAYDAVSVRIDGTDPVALAKAGACPCAGGGPPFLTWSPDGTQLAIATRGTDSGIYTVAPDGSDLTLRDRGDWGWLTWQPAAE